VNIYGEVGSRVVSKQSSTGRLLSVPQHQIPQSEAVGHVNLGEHIPIPLLKPAMSSIANGSGETIPSTGPPYAMTRCVVNKIIY